MSELNKEQIMTSLECCATSTSEDCAKCLYYGKASAIDDIFISCCNLLIKDAFALIKELTEENEMYRKTVGTLLKKNGKVVGLGRGKEVEYIEKDLADTFKKMAVNRVKADTAKKILDRAIDKSVCKDHGDGTERLFIGIPDLREIVEEVTSRSDEDKQRMA